MSSTQIQTPSSRIQNPFFLAIFALSARELIRFIRQRTRVVSALGQPVLFWVLFGAGLRGSFSPPGWAEGGMTYQEYFFPGVAVMIVMFTAIFSTISIIEDRREGFLQGVLVAPVSRLAIVLGKLCGGTVLAVVQAALFLALGPFLGLELSLIMLIEVLLFLALLGFSLTALGFAIAWPLDSTQGFHAIMMLFLMPMWLLSGSFFPAADKGWLSWVIAANPLTYGVAGLRRLLYKNILPTAPGLPGMGVCLAVTIAFCIVCIGASVWLAERRTSADTR